MSTVLKKVENYSETCVQENVENLTAMVDKFFEGGEEVYRYVNK